MTPSSTTTFPFEMFLTPALISEPGFIASPFDVAYKLDGLSAVTTLPSFKFPSAWLATGVSYVVGTMPKSSGMLAVKFQASSFPPSEPKVVAA